MCKQRTQKWKKIGKREERREGGRGREGEREGKKDLEGTDDSRANKLKLLLVHAALRSSYD